MNEKSERDAKFTDQPIGIRSASRFLPVDKFQIDLQLLRLSTSLRLHRGDLESIWNRSRIDHRGLKGEETVTKRG